MDERQLKEVFALCDVGWVFDEDPGDRALQILKEMHQVDREFASKLQRSLDPPLAIAILSDVTRFKPLVQAFASPMSTAIRTMVYCVLDGAQIQGIRVDYKFKVKALLEVDVEYDSGLQATFASNNVYDFEALRHFGLMKLGDAPVVDGYYAFRKGD